MAEAAAVYRHRGWQRRLVSPNVQPVPGVHGTCHAGDSDQIHITVKLFWSSYIHNKSTNFNTQILLIKSLYNFIGNKARRR